MLKALSSTSSHLSKASSSFSYIQTQTSSLLVSSSFRRVPSSRKAIASPIPAPSPPSIRRPDGDRCSPWSTSSSVSTSKSRRDGAGAVAVDDELQLFLEVVPPRLRRKLIRHGEIRELIEVVMDLGRKPIARFPSGDWIMSEQPVALDDLRHAVSQVISDELLKNKKK